MYCITRLVIYGISTLKRFVVQRSRFMKLTFNSRLGISGLNFNLEKLLRYVYL